jgi:hypothetical protein
MPVMQDRSSQRLVAVSVLGALLFNYPLLALFNRAVLVLGIPLVYLYVFAAWALVIGLIALALRRAAR